MAQDLANTSVAELCRELASADANGRLTVTRDDSTVEVWFRDGRIYRASSKDDSLRLGDRLVKGALLKQSALDRALSEQESAGQPIGALLVKSGVISETVVRAFVHEQIIDGLFGVVRWTSGTHEYDEDTAADEPLPVDLTVEQALFAVETRHRRWDEITRSVPSLDAVATALHGLGEDDQLDPAVAALLAAIDGEHTVQQLAELLGFASFETAVMVHDLVVRGLASVADLSTPDAPEVGPEVALIEFSDTEDDGATAGTGDEPVGATEASPGHDSDGGGDEPAMVEDELDAWATHVVAEPDPNAATADVAPESDAPAAADPDHDVVMETREVKASFASMGDFDDLAAELAALAGGDDEMLDSLGASAPEPDFIVPTIRHQRDLDSVDLSEVDEPDNVVSIDSGADELSLEIADVDPEADVYVAPVQAASADDENFQPWEGFIDKGAEAAEDAAEETPSEDAPAMPPIELDHEDAPVGEELDDLIASLTSDEPEPEPESEPAAEDAAPPEPAPEPVEPKPAAPAPTPASNADASELLRELQSLQGGGMTAPKPKSEPDGPKDDGKERRRGLFGK